MLAQLTINTPHFSDAFLSWALHAFAFLVLVLTLVRYLRKDLPPDKFLSIWETDGVLSSRQILAWVIACYGMYMRYLGNLEDEGLWKCFEASFILFGIGGAVKAVAAIKPGTTANAKQVDEMNVAPKDGPE